MVCLDNSEYSRNGDHGQSRMMSQTTAANIVVNTKTKDNPENSCGVLTMAGEFVKVLVTPSQDLGKILASFNEVNIGGETDLYRGIQMATLALKHRQNKTERQRIVAFVGSPVSASEEELDKLGKQLKKNNVSIDIISFGEITENEAKLAKLYNSANANESSHILTVEPGPVLLADAVRQSPILGGTPAGVDAAGPGGDADFDLAETDPELAMAIRISMEEERARQMQSGEGGAPAAAPAPAAPAAAAAAPSAVDDPLLAALDPEVLANLDEMDPELREALLLSVQDQNPPPAAAEEPPAKKAKAEEAEAPAAAGQPADMNAMFQDVDFVQDLLGGLPGVDMQDSRIQEALAAVGVPTEKKDEDKDKEKKKDDKDAA